MGAGVDAAPRPVDGRAHIRRGDVRGDGVAGLARQVARNARRRRRRRRRWPTAALWGTAQTRTEGLHFRQTPCARARPSPPARPCGRSAQPPTRPAPANAGSVPLSLFNLSCPLPHSLSSLESGTLGPRRSRPVRPQSVAPGGGRRRGARTGDGGQRPTEAGGGPSDGPKGCRLGDWPGQVMGQTDPARDGPGRDLHLTRTAAPMRFMSGR
jgi:hypothetical protein